MEKFDGFADRIGQHKCENWIYNIWGERISKETIKLARQT